MSLTVLRPITLKARVTENLKSRMTAELKSAVELLDRELQEIDSQGKRMQLTAQLSPQQQLALRQTLEFEKNKRLEQKDELKARMEDVQNLRLGQEIAQGTIQGPVEIEVGTDWEATLDVEVLLEDGKVVSIRKG